MRYPFSLEARQTSQKLARDLGALVSLLDRPDYQYIVKEAQDRVYAALTQSQIRYPSMENESDVLIYPAARLIVEKIGLPQLLAWTDLDGRDNKLRAFQRFLVMSMRADGELRLPLDVQPVGQTMDNIQAVGISVH